jgi:hypothetical protein
MNEEGWVERYLGLWPGFRRDEKQRREMEIMLAGYREQEMSHRCEKGK